MSRNPRPAVPMVLACLAVLPGCYSTQNQAPLPVPMRLVSPTGFDLSSDTRESAAAGSCTVTRAELDMVALRGDTLRFSRVRVLAQSAGSPGCAFAGEGYLIVSKHPDLRSERSALSGWRSWLAVVAGVPALAGTLLLIVLLAGGATWST